MDEQNENARRTKARAGEYAPGELWTEVSPGIFVAASRTPKSEEQVRTYEKELAHARIVAAEGHISFRNAAPAG
jgi:hypothetical protein